MMTVLALVGLALAAVLAIGALVDRAARAEAWRQIAQERRWNQETAQRRTR
jgi:hypothetical protein